MQLGETQLGEVWPDITAMSSSQLAHAVQLCRFVSSLHVQANGHLAICFAADESNSNDGRATFGFLVSDCHAREVSSQETARQLDLAPYEWCGRADVVHAAGDRAGTRRAFHGTFCYGLKLFGSLWV